MIFDGKKLQKKILAEVASRVRLLSRAPAFTDIQIGNDPVNAKYVAMKKKTALALGFDYRDVFFPDGTPIEVILGEINKLNNDPHMAGVIVQLPLPAGYDKETILNAVAVHLDADVLGNFASKAFYDNAATALVLPTAAAIMKIIDEAHISFAGKKVLIAGQGPLVGRPVAHLLRNRGISFDVITKETPSDVKQQLLHQADIIISATGTPHAITGAMVKEGVVVIDAGTSEMEGSIVGDVHFESVAPKAFLITPSPGGVGPVTVACLFENVCILSQR